GSGRPSEPDDLVRCSRCSELCQSDRRSLAADEARWFVRSLVGHRKVGVNRGLKTPWRKWGRQSLCSDTVSAVDHRVRRHGGAMHRPALKGSAALMLPAPPINVISYFSAAS